MLRIGRRQGAAGAASGLYEHSAVLMGRLLLVAGLVLVGWLLSSAVASAATVDTVSDKAESAVSDSSSSSEFSDADNVDEAGESAARDTAPEEGANQPKSTSATPDRDTDSGSEGDSTKQPVSSAVDGASERTERSVPSTHTPSSQANQKSAQAQRKASEKSADASEIVDDVERTKSKTMDTADNVTGSTHARDDDDSTSETATDTEHASTQDAGTSARKAPDFSRVRAADIPADFRGVDDSSGDTEKSSSARSSATSAVNAGHFDVDPTSAPQSQLNNLTPALGFAGYLSEAHLASPTYGPLQAAWNALDMAPRGPVEKPTVSPD